MTIKLADLTPIQQRQMKFLARCYPIARWVPGRTADALERRGLVVNTRLNHFTLSAAGCKLMGLMDE